MSYPMKQPEPEFITIQINDTNYQAMRGSARVVRVTGILHGSLYPVLATTFRVCIRCRLEVRHIKGCEFAWEKIEVDIFDNRMFPTRESAEVLVDLFNSH